ncbi:MAG: MBL fold metallo-hydrolase [Comamonas sp.]|nr:MBL fold metallo-hydrolase [Comamonas sp.]
MTTARIQSFFDPATFTVTHIVSCPHTQRAAVIDSVLDYDQKSGRTGRSSADQVIAYVREQNLTVDWLLETHAHADHLSAAPYLREHIGGKIAIGSHIRQVQEVFKKVFNAKDMNTEGLEFDHLFEDGEHFQIGQLAVEVLHTPGHTPACLSYVVGDKNQAAPLDVFVGDTLFMPDYGTARCDFPGGDAATLYRSIQKLLALPPQTRLHLCHDYPPAERQAQWLCTVAEQRAGNIHVREGSTEEAFVAMRTARDATLAMPQLILPAIQVNVRAGKLPPAEDNGVRYLKIPLDLL